MVAVQTRCYQISELAVTARSIVCGEGDTDFQEIVLSSRLEEYDLRKDTKKAIKRHKHYL